MKVTIACHIFGMVGIGIVMVAGVYEEGYSWHWLGSYIVAMAAWLLGLWNGYRGDN